MGLQPFGARGRPVRTWLECGIGLVGYILLFPVLSGTDWYLVGSIAVGSGVATVVVFLTIWRLRRLHRDQVLQIWLGVILATPVIWAAACWIAAGLDSDALAAAWMGFLVGLLAALSWTVSLLLTLTITRWLPFQFEHWRATHPH